MIKYSGYVEHSDFLITPQSYQDAFNFLCQLAFESDENVFYIGKAIECEECSYSEEEDNFYLENKVKFEWNEDRGAYEHA